jgi:hypothetical protein
MPPIAAEEAIEFVSGSHATWPGCGARGGDNRGKSGQRRGNGVGLDKVAANVDNRHRAACMWQR